MLDTPQQPKRKMLHTSPDIQWSLCDGCGFLEVKDLRDRTLFKLYRERPFEYTCWAMSKDGSLTKKDIYEMTSAKCPVMREAKRRRR